MKKYFFIFILISFISKGQNFFISTYDTVQYGNCGDLMLAPIIFTNTSVVPVQMHMNRIVKNIPSGWTSCFCYPTCLAQTTNTLDFIIPIASGKVAGTQTVSPNFGTDSIPGTGIIIVVFNEIGTTVYDTITFRGITSSPAGVQSIEKESPVIYPNPVADFIVIKNSEKQIKSIQLLSMEGKETNHTLTEYFKNEIKIDIKMIPAGIYYLLIECTDNLTFRKKIIKS